MQRGNPPGKDGSLGDAINWETLLKKMPNQELFLITDDKDYISQVGDSRLAQFLTEEWEEHKTKEIHLYRKLSDFFRDKFPKIKLASEMEKELAISELTKSGKFQTTHNAIANLSKFTDFTTDELNAIVDAAISNSQIYWIAQDADVKAFMQGLLVGRESSIDSEKLKKFKACYLTPDQTAEIEKEDLPF